MSEREIVQVVEIDIDQCTRTWGSSPCLASFGAGVTNKCYNSFGTCAYKAAYNKGVNTLKFIAGSYPLKDGNYIPALVSVSGREQEVNIAGYSSDLKGLGQRASVTLTFDDFPYRDTLTDKYWAERISGAAQADGIGYDPIDRGSFWSKFKARNPNYAGRPIRVIEAHYDGAGGLVYDRVRSYIMDEFVGPQNGSVTIRAKDILALADDAKAQAPRASRGRLSADITAAQTSASLTPAGIGNGEYPASGYAVIGSEIVRFTRTGNNLTLVRGQRGTDAATHSVNDTFQLCYDVVYKRVDEVIYELLVTYGNVPSGYITFSDWSHEFDRWGANFFASATIPKPNGVTKLLGEICQTFAVTLWWDEIAQKIRLRLNHPPEEPPATWSDRNNIMSITQEDNDNERATQIEIWSMQINPTRELNKDNFTRGDVFVDVDAISPNMFGIPSTHEILTRWLNHGDEKAIKIMGRRLLNRYRRAPVIYNVTIDNKDYPEIADVIALETYVATDVTGLPQDVLTQVYYRADERNGDTVRVKLQMFQFDARYGVITENSRPDYNSSTPEQKRKGSYFVGPSGVFSDGGRPYNFI